MGKFDRKKRPKRQVRGIPSRAWLAPYPNNPGNSVKKNELTAHDYFVTRFFVREGFQDANGGSNGGSDIGDDNRKNAGKKSGDGGSNGGRDGGSVDGGNNGGATPKPPLNAIQCAILGLIQSESSITRKGIAAKLGLTVDGARCHLKKIASAGVIKYVGSSRNGHWMVTWRQND